MRYFPLLVGSLFVLADIHLESPPSIAYRGSSCDKGNAVEITVDGDDFPFASSATPIFLRLELSHNVTLCETLVDFEGIDSQGLPHSNRPIYLAGKLLFWGLPEYENHIDLFAVSIVRWIAGESSIWIKITQPTDQWLTLDGMAAPPSAEQPVIFAIAESAQASDIRHYTYSLQGSNFGANSPFPDQLLPYWGAEPNYAISTLLGLNLQGSNAQDGDDIYLYPSLFDHTTQGVSTFESTDSIILGNTLPISVAAQGAIVKAAADPFETQWSQLNQNVVFQKDLLQGTVIEISDAREFEVHGGHSFYPESEITLTTTDPSTHAFELVVNQNGFPIVVGTLGGVELWLVAGGARKVNGRAGFIPYTTPDEVFTHDGMLYTPKFTCLWVGPDVSPSYFGILKFQFVNQFRILTSSQNAGYEIEASLNLKTYGPRLDEFPWDGTLDDGDPNTGITATDQAFDLPESAIPISRFHYLGAITEPSEVSHWGHSEKALVYPDGSAPPSLATLARTYPSNGGLVIESIDERNQSTTTQQSIEGPISSLDFELLRTVEPQILRSLRNTTGAPIVAATLDVSRADVEPLAIAHQRSQHRLMVPSHEGELLELVIFNAGSTTAELQVSGMDSDGDQIGLPTVFVAGKSHLRRPLGSFSWITEDPNLADEPLLLLMTSNQPLAAGTYLPGSTWRNETLISSCLDSSFSNWHEFPVVPPIFQFNRSLEFLVARPNLEHTPYRCQIRVTEETGAVWSASPTLWGPIEAAQIHYVGTTLVFRVGGRTYPFTPIGFDATMGDHPFDIRWEFEFPTSVRGTITQDGFITKLQQTLRTTGNYQFVISGSEEILLTLISDAPDLETCLITFHEVDGDIWMTETLPTNAWARLTIGLDGVEQGPNSLPVYPIHVNEGTFLNSDSILEAHNDDAGFVAELIQTDSASASQARAGEIAPQVRFATWSKVPMVGDSQLVILTNQPDLPMTVEIEGEGSPEVLETVAVDGIVSLEVAGLQQNDIIRVFEGQGSGKSLRPLLVRSFDGFWIDAGPDHAFIDGSGGIALNCEIQVDLTSRTNQDQIFVSWIANGEILGYGTSVTVYPTETTRVVALAYDAEFNELIGDEVILFQQDFITELGQQLPTWPNQSITDLLCLMLGPSCP